jgi:hypothetical protein
MRYGVLVESPNGIEIIMWNSAEARKMVRIYIVFGRFSNGLVHRIKVSFLSVITLQVKEDLHVITLRQLSQYAKRGLA